MFELIHTLARQDLIKQTRQYFAREGWKIDPRDHPSADYVIRRDSYNYTVACLDATILKYRSLETISEGLTSNAGYFRSRVGYPYLVILNCNESICDYLATKGVLAVSSQDLAFICRFMQSCAKPPSELTPREKIAVQGSETLCLSMSDQYLQEGDLIAAVQWAELLTQYPVGNLPGYRKLVRIHLGNGNLAAAESIAERALNRQPNNTFFLGKMYELAVLKKDATAMEHWLDRAANVPKTMNFDTIIKRVRQSNSGSIPEDTIISSQSHTADRGILGKLARLLK